MGYYVPWHIDNLYLDILVERGLPALLAFVTCAAVVLRRLARAGPRGPAFAPFLASSLAGALCAGLVNSVMDVPRVAFLMFIIAIAGAELGADINAPAAP
jgi:O-antigen ligase